MPNVTDFTEIVRKIENDEIMLPDFQREFAWKDEQMQKNIVCSVLAKMPIGSILLLQSKADEYLCKKIGTKIVSPSISDKVVEFLLDGQQRITVLANVFSNVVFDNCQTSTGPGNINFNELISLSLKRRFFLRIPKWEAVSKTNNVDSEIDIFHVYDLNFPLKRPHSDIPEFLTGDIRSFIECIQFRASDNLPFNPKTPLSTKLDDFCEANEKGYLIPLFLLAPTGNNISQCNLRLQTIIENISLKIKNSIIDYYNLPNTNKSNFTSDLFANDPNSLKQISQGKPFEEVIEDNAKNWKQYMNSFLSSCVTELVLNEICVEEKQRARAIDIYENLNRGGVTLSPFDLIMAKAAKKDKRNYYRRIFDCLSSQKNKHNVNLLPLYNKAELLKNMPKDYNASFEIGCYDEVKNEVSSKFIDAFLNILSLYSYNPGYDDKKVTIELIKRQKILDLSPDSINDNCEKICEALDRTFFFLQTRCGIRKLNEVNYNLILTVIGIIFTNDKWYKNLDAHNKLEAWYWAVLFSGEYDKDQTDTTIKYIQKFFLMFSTPSTKWNAQWIKDISTNVLKFPNFSDKDLLLMKKVNDDRYPKEVLKKFICEYFLSRTYPDMFDTQKTISVFCKDKDTLEAHHIIPLGSVKKIGETTSALRKNQKHICNSPLNFVLITKAANDAISDDDPITYSQKISNSANSILGIQTNYGNLSITDPLFTENVLINRYNFIEGRIKKSIQDLL